jgi:hypothetical protein
MELRRLGYDVLTSYDAGQAKIQPLSVCYSGIHEISYEVLIDLRENRHNSSRVIPQPSFFHKFLARESHYACSNRRFTQVTLRRE